MTKTIVIQNVVAFFSIRRRNRFTGYASPVARIDRNNWRFYTFETIDVAKADDVHFPRPLDKEWRRVRPLFIRLFNKAECDFIDRYYQIYQKLENSTMKN